MARANKGTEIVKGTLADLRPDKHNARRHTPANIGLIADSLQEVGAARSIVVDEDNEIMGGNGVYEAAAQVGMEDVVFVDVDGNTIVAVRRHGLSARQKERLALLDNRAGELSDWDVVELAKKHEDDPTILDGLFPDDEKAFLLKMAEQTPPNVEFPEYDESVADQVEYITCPECGHKWPK